MRVATIAHAEKLRVFEPQEHSEEPIVETLCPAKNGRSRLQWAGTNLLLLLLVDEEKCCIIMVYDPQDGRLLGRVPQRRKLDRPNTMFFHSKFDLLLLAWQDGAVVILTSVVRRPRKELKIFSTSRDL